MKQYLDLVSRILKEGRRKSNRTGVDTIALAGAVFEHDMSEGFPVLTTKRMPLKSVFTELEFFIKGLTDKRWLQNRNCKIWNEWCNPEKVPYGHDEETHKKMAEERDLGPIYGFQWRHFGAEYFDYNTNYSGKGIDQLDNVVKKLKADPTDRRMIVSAWNPTQLHQMALPPCHLEYQVTVIGNKLNLAWNQRSVDTMLGLPFNIVSYAMLLKLLSEESHIPEGKLIGFLVDTHIYENHIEKAKEQLSREPYKLPKVDTKDFKSIYDWKADEVEIEDYKHHPAIKFDIAI